jgi:hypothetical protein
MRKIPTQKIPVVAENSENEKLSNSTKKTNLDKIIESKKSIPKSKKENQIDEKNQQS